MAKKKTTDNDTPLKAEVPIEVAQLTQRVTALETNTEVEDLKDRVNALESTVAALSKRLDTLF